MSLLVDLFRRLCQQICFTFLKKGTVPNHVVFLVTEVPKYYGLQNSYDEITYQRNFQKILDCADWCTQLGIAEISVYTFSCLTFKFPSQEVKKVLYAFENTIKLWVQDCESFHDNSYLHRKGIRIIVIDKSSILSDTMGSVAHKLVHLTENNTRLTLNIVIGYLSDADVAPLVSSFEEEIKTTPDLTRKDFHQRLFNYQLHEPQLVVSNCSHRRLTDYLIWKTPARYIHHIHIAWGEFTWWYFVVCLLYFRNHQAKF